MLRVLRNTAFAVVAMLSLTGCFKKVTTDTTLRIKVVAEVKVIEEATGNEIRKDRIPAQGCYAYLYYVDKRVWTIASYEEAAAKTITNSESGEKLSQPDVESEPFSLEGSTSNYLSLWQSSPSALVVVVFPEAQMYAYTYRYSSAENLPYTYLTLIYHTWKTGSYNEGSKDDYKWTVVAPETTVMPPIIIPSEQPEQPSEPETPEQPTEPETPEQPEQPTEPEQPSEQPSEPEAPETNNNL